MVVNSCSFSCIVVEWQKEVHPDAVIQQHPQLGQVSQKPVGRSVFFSALIHAT
jgi:hypothetical protein